MEGHLSIILDFFFFLCFWRAEGGDKGKEKLWNEEGKGEKVFKVKFKTSHRDLGHSDIAT